MKEYETTYARDRFYTIIISQCQTSMSKYKLYKKVLDLRLACTKPRTISRRRSNSSSRETGFLFWAHVTFFVFANSQTTAYNEFTDTARSKMLTQFFKIPHSRRAPLRSIGPTDGAATAGSKTKQSSKCKFRFYEQNHHRPNQHSNFRIDHNTCMCRSRLGKLSRVSQIRSNSISKKLSTSTALQSKSAPRSRSGTTWWWWW